jgi:hypothetical protein
MISWRAQAIEGWIMANDVESQPPKESKGILLAAVLSIGLLALWNTVTFATLTEDNSILGHGPLPHTLHERFLILWFMAGVVWLTVLISALVQRSSFRIAVSLAAWLVCVLAWLVNAAGWVECISSC